jgi:hypothetical protein
MKDYFLDSSTNMGNICGNPKVSTEKKLEKKVSKIRKKYLVAAWQWVRKI